MRSHEAADTIGISYRRLDYLTRCGVLDDRADAAGRSMNSGSGTRRTWDPGVVIRLALAWHIAEALPTAGDRGHSLFPGLAAAAIAADPPPRRGYGLVAPDPVTLLWAASWADVRTTLQDVGAAMVVTYDLDDIIGDRIDLDSALGHTG